MKVALRKNIYELAQVPTEDKWFQVNPLGIDQELFNQPREDIKQERVRKIILSAFEEMKKNSKYLRPFKTMMPKKSWSSKTIIEIKELACELGDHNADMYEQALEWAQRIANGETWESICNEPDNSNWYRVIIWKNGNARIFGGSRMCENKNPATTIYFHFYTNYKVIKHMVPLVVSYE